MIQVSRIAHRGVHGSSPDGETDALIDLQSHNIIIALALLPWADFSIRRRDVLLRLPTKRSCWLRLNHPAEGGNVVDNRINGPFFRLLTPFKFQLIAVGFTELAHGADNGI